MIRRKNFCLLNPLTYVLINVATVLLIARAGVQVNIGESAAGAGSSTV